MRVSKKAMKRAFVEAIENASAAKTTEAMRQSMLAWAETYFADKRVTIRDEVEKIEKAKQLYAEGATIPNIASFLGISIIWTRKILGLQDGGIELDKGIKLSPRRSKR